MNRPLVPSAAILILAALMTVPPLAGGESRSEVLTLRYWQAPSTLNPHLSAGFKDHEACRIVYEPLATFDADGNLVPVLAAEIPSRQNGGLAADGRSVTWRLKDGLRWSDGHPVTAGDVRFTYDYITHPAVDAATSASYRDVTEVTVVDDRTVRVRFEAPNPLWAAPFTGTRGMILPRHIFMPYTNAQARSAPPNRAPVGTGPYRVRSFSPEEMLLIGDDLVSLVKITYVPNPFYRNGTDGLVARLVIEGGGDVMGAARAALVTGSADFAWNLQAAMGPLRSMAEAGVGRLVILPSSNVERIVVNQTDPNRATESGERSSLRFPHPVLSDIRVRQAVAHAVDRRSIGELLGVSEPMVTNILVSPPRYRSLKPASPYPYDLDRARKLLAAAGWNDADGDGAREKAGTPLRLTFQTSVNPVRKAIARIIKRYLERIGIDVTLKMIDASVFFNGDPDNPNNFHHFYADLQQYAIGNRLPEPDIYLSYWTCDQIPQAANGWSGANDGRWCNPDYDARLKAATTSLDRDRRRRIFIGLNDTLVEEVAVIPLQQKSFIHGAARTLAGVELTPWDAATWRIEKWHRAP